MGLSKAYRMMLLAGCAATAMASGAQAQDARSEGIVLDELTVVPGKVEQAPIDTPASVSVVDENEIARRQAETLAEVFQGMPGVVAVQDNDQPGATINIRGLQDFGRVAVIVDGARQNFQISKHGGQNPIFIEPDLLKAVTVVRGPVANIYGSGAIGGVVVFETLDARDILLPGETTAGILKSGYETNGDG